MLGDVSNSSKRERCYDVRKEARVKKRSLLLEVILDAKSGVIEKRSCHESDRNFFRIYLFQFDGRCQSAESKMTLARERRVMFRNHSDAGNEERWFDVRYATSFRKRYLMLYLMPDAKSEWEESAMWKLSCQDGLQRFCRLCCED